jgi:hypothetical protein
MIRCLIPYRSFIEGNIWTNLNLHMLWCLLINASTVLRRRFSPIYYTKRLLLHSGGLWFEQLWVCTARECLYISHIKKYANSNVSIKIFFPYISKYTPTHPPKKERGGRGIHYWFLRLKLCFKSWSDRARSGSSVTETFHSRTRVSTDYLRRIHRWKTVDNRVQCK